MSKMIAYTGLNYSGRTTVILNKAYVLAKEGYKVLVIDADQTKGNISACLNLAQIEIGLQQAVTSLDETAFRKCFIYDKKTKLTFLTLPITAKCDDLFSLTFNQAESFYQKIRTQYDYILVDGGNIFYEALSAVALFEADQIYLVLQPEKRAMIWAASTKDLFSNFQHVNLVIVNLTESPEIPQDQIYNRYKELPYVSNMRDYAAMDKIFLQDPTGKKAQDYVKAILDLVESVKEL